MSSVFHMQISIFVGVSSAALFVFAMFWSAFWAVYYFSPRRGCSFFFDPQDTVRFNPGSRPFPVSAETATFEPMLKHYIGVTQLLVTVAAASIAFGGNGQASSASIAAAKLLLAWSIFYGVLFCAFLIWRYDEYAQNVRSYTLFWYSSIFALGFSCLVCFMFGYLAWGWGLSRAVA
jgi:hypothetical protein